MSVRPAGPGFSRAIVGLIVAGAVQISAAHPTSQTPQFRGGVELVAVDVQVIDKTGQPIATLGPADFEVSIGRKSRPVVSADFIRHASSTPVADPTAPIAAPPPNPQVPTGRTIVLAVDEHSFGAAAAQAAMQAAGRFLDHLEPSDLVGVYAYPSGASSLNLTSDHAAVRKSLDRIAGLLEVPASQYHLTAAEVIDITAGDSQALAAVVARECRPGDRYCNAIAVRVEATSLAGVFEIQVAQSLDGLHALLQTVSRWPGRKILVVVSGGLLASDRAGGRPDLTMETLALGRMAADANATLYGLHMDSSFLDAFSQGSRRGATPALLRDSSVLGRGFERFTAAAGGTLIRIEAGSGDSAFAQVLRETSAYYLLAVEPSESDRDGKSHPIRVKVKTRGATVRSRTVVTIPRR